MDDRVNHPKHYTSTPFGLEVIAITRHYNFCVGNALKYILRAGLKHEDGMTDAEKTIEDFKKAVWYLNKHIEDLERKAATADMTTAKLDAKSVDQAKSDIITIDRVRYRIVPEVVPGSCHGCAFHNSENDECTCNDANLCFYHDAVIFKKL